MEKAVIGEVKARVSASHLISGGGWQGVLPETYQFFVFIVLIQMKAFLATDIIWYVPDYTVYFGLESVR
ncbi:MAG TPA: hypothetical protein PKA00_09975 [Saprospiraceae bacterium]|nr:hypothetical protein [Saprospiraceae bacterium]HMQ83225.1 hypothetical protein [Saprospiraceae bacterium]